jgi:hypothetical protein
MTREHLPQQAYYYNPVGRRDVGRPRKKWNSSTNLVSGLRPIPCWGKRKSDIRIR